MIRDIVFFGKDFAPPPHADIKSFGRKAANLATMALAGINIPASAVLPIGLIDYFLNKPNDAKAWLDDNLDRIFQDFGVNDETLLAVRLSPVYAVPGLSLTVLGLGQTMMMFRENLVLCILFY